MTDESNDDASGLGLGFPRATYSKQAIREQAGNKFIEALPPLTDEAALIRGMWLRADVTDEDRAQSAFIRLHMIEAIPASFMQPLTDHVLLATQVSAMIRAGYLTRNPSSPAFLRNLGQAVAAFGRSTAVRSDVAGHGMAVIGMSGVGKSTAIDAVLQTYPRVIWHPDLTGPLRTTHQVTWLKLVCPLDGSLKTLCRDYFRGIDKQLGTNYHRLHVSNGTVESMRDAMASLAFVHGLGILVIDEVQNLAAAKGVNQATLLNFFLVLRDVLGIPVITIGTEEAALVLGGTMKQARRHAGQPLFERMADDAEFVIFCNAMFGAYYLRQPLDPTPEFRRLLYELSQGIADILIKLFMLAQARALVMGTESIDADALQAVYDQCLHLLHGHLDDIRKCRKVHGPAYEAALRDVRAAGLAPVTAPQAAARANTGKRERAAECAPAGKPGPDARGRGGATPIEASALAAAVDGRAAGTSEHAALKAAGFIRELGADIVAGH